MPQIKIIKSGVIDGDAALDNVKPLAEQYTGRRACWLGEIEGATQHEGQQKSGEVGKRLDELKAAMNKM